MEAGELRTLGPPAPGLGRRREAVLVRAAQRGSGEAMEELFKRHWRGALRAAYLVVHDGPAAEDIAQEAFISAIRSLDRFDRRRPFAPWLHRIVVNRAIDWTRARSARREVSSEASGALDLASTEPDLAAGADAGRVVAALASLGPEQRAVVVMRYVLDYTPGEIAEILDLPRGTVNSRIRRGLDALAQVVEREA
ncbi:MAG: sigma-70 family RNA polymerase sigma factor [Actinomycetota bacterium]|nr:sigma-70 family RNA polymerase sigma factor [Actinomycetota bacterium]